MKREDAKKIKSLPYVGAKFAELKKIDEIIGPIIKDMENPIFIDLFGGSGVVGFYVNLVYGIPVIYNEKNEEQFNILNLSKDPEKKQNFYEWYGAEYEKYYHADADKLGIFNEYLEDYKKTSNLFARIMLQQMAFRGIVETSGRIIPNMRKVDGINTIENRVKKLEDIKKFYENIGRDDITLINSDYIPVLEKYKNNPNAIIYMDPPYLRDKNTLGYVEMIRMEDFFNMREAFNYSARVILHVDYTAYFREDLFKDFYHSSYPKKYSLAKDMTKRFYSKYHAFFTNFPKLEL